MHMRMSVEFTSKQAESVEQAVRKIKIHDLIEMYHGKQRNFGQPDKVFVGVLGSEEALPPGTICKSGEKYRIFFVWNNLPEDFKSLIRDR